MNQIVLMLLLAGMMGLAVWGDHEHRSAAERQRTEIAALRAEIQRLKTAPPEGMKCRDYTSGKHKIRSCWQRKGV